MNLGAGTKVHVVFTSDHLYKRDPEEFADILFNIEEAETKIEYHVGIDFEAVVGALVLIDEADISMIN